MRQRDTTLDAMKGIGCVLMVLIHTRQFFEYDVYRNVVMDDIFVLGSFAPIFFFAVAGVTASFQTLSKRTDLFLAFYVLFFFLGLSYNGIQQVDFYADPQMDILLMIALGSMVVYLVEKYARPGNVTRLALALATFGVHGLVSWEYAGVPDFPLRQLIFARGLFPVFPWLSFCFTGVLVYNLREKWRMLLGAAFLVVLAVFILGGGEPDFGEKWDMSAGYFLLATGFLFASWVVVRRFRLFEGNRVMDLFGKYSLLFLFVHLLVIGILIGMESAVQEQMDAMAGVYPVYPLVIWGFVLGATYGVIQVIDHYGPRLAHLFRNLPVWLAILAGVLTAPLLFGDSVVTMGVEAGLGILVATYYRELSGVVQGLGKKP